MEDDHESLPPELVRALEQQDRSIAVVTARVDREIAVRAAAHFASRRPRVALPRWPAAVAASMVLAIGAYLTASLDGADAVAGVFADHDGNGRIDIADVMLVARAGVDQDLVEVFARKIVALDEGS